MRFLAGLAVISALIATPAQAEPIVERLYPGVAPGSEAWKQPEAVQKTPRGEVTTNVRDPQITAYLPDPAKANGAAVILLPGGALRLLSEGTDQQDTIRRLNERGIAAIVLKYRTVQGDPAAAARMMPPPAPPGAKPAQPAFLKKLEIRNANANPAPNDAELNTVLRLATADAQAALRRVRGHAKEWRIDPAKVGLLGWSAGGGVAMGAVVADAPGAAPDFVISLFGPSLQDVVVPAKAPPLFLATETSHGPVTDGLVALYGVWHEAGKPVELHVLDIPNFSITFVHVEGRVFDWLSEKKFIPSAR